MLTDIFQKSNCGQLFDDFDRYIAANYTLTHGTGGTVAQVTAATTSYGGAMGGWLNVPTAASQHDYQSISTLHPVAELLSITPSAPVGNYVSAPEIVRPPVKAEARIMLTEAATNSSNWYFGLTDTLTTGLIGNAGTPASSFHGAVFFKPAGTNVIAAMVSNGTTQSTIANVGTFVSGLPILLTVDIDPADGVTAKVKFEVNTDYSVNRTPLPPASLTIAGMAPMYLSTGVNASTTAAETLQLDYWGLDFYRV